MKPLNFNLKLFTSIPEQQVLTITFEKIWYQEDIADLLKQILAPLSQVNIIEQTSGADREDVRFTWQGHYLMLHFEYYSQSCWLDTQQGQDRSILSNLQKQLNQQQPT